MHRLAQLVQDRRSSLRLSKDKAAELAGMSPVTWTRVEDGLTVRALTYAGVEAVLGWPARGIKRYLKDGDEAPLRGDLPASEPGESVDRSADLGSLLAAMDDPEGVLRMLREQLDDHGPDVFWATLERIWRYHVATGPNEGGSRQVG